MNTTVTYQQYQRVVQLGTDSGFFQAYFDALKDARTNEEAFLQINEECLDTFGEERYVSYGAFRMHLNRWLKKRKTSNK